jgi:UDP-N-acetylmuramoyl-L-alanyl-D-glutamate--2,6-diaminopimelate ligase
VTSLDTLLHDAGVDAKLSATDAAVQISTVELDSRRCTTGSVFVCMPGTTTTGRAFVDDAVSRGAVCVISDAPTVAPISVQVPTASLRGTLAALASAVVGHPDRDLTLAGVTGTNGKTTITWLIEGLLDRSGYCTTSIGTLTGPRTTPSPPELHRGLRAALDRSTSIGQPGAVAMEVSSHALDQGRVDGLRFDVAVFTNLSHEHLDYHETMERYFEAKAELFDEARSARAVICIDDEWGTRLARRRTTSRVEVATSDATLLEAAIGRTSFQWRGVTWTTKLTGHVNVTNVMLAVVAAEALGVDRAGLGRAIADVAPVPGRLEPVGDGVPQVLVDYAHTPAALERVLLDLRELGTARQVIVVFGCGGDRDAAKRPLMGAVATRLADVVVVTSDNPRTEDPERILDEVLAGATGPATTVRIADREAAIRAAVAQAGDDDLVLIAGKGHETTQEVAGELLELDDRVVARAALSERRPAC